MTETLSFPGLGLEIPLNPVIIQITDTWAIKWYGVIVTLAFVCGCAYVFKRTRRFGLDPDRVLDVLIGAVLGGIVGARLYYVAFSWETQFAYDPMRVFRIWEGGIAIYGGIIGGLLVGILMCRWREIKVLPMVDLAAGGLLLGQAIGRWGNFVNMEAFGSNTDMPWGMTSPTIRRYLQMNRAWLLEKTGVAVDPMQPVHPTFLYESLWCIIGFVLLHQLSKRRRFDGELGLVYIGWYGLGRFWIEALRTDSLLLGNMRVSQILAILCVAAVLIILAVLRAKINRVGDPAFLRLYVDTPVGRAVAIGESYEEAKKLAAEPQAEHRGAALCRGAGRKAPGGRPKRLHGKLKMAEARFGDMAMMKKAQRKR